MRVGKGLALSDIITEIHQYIQRIEFPSKVFILLTKKLADIEMRLASGTNEDVQCSALIAVFQMGVDLTTPDD